MSLLEVAVFALVCVVVTIVFVLTRDKPSHTMEENEYIRFNNKRFKE